MLQRSVKVTVLIIMKHRMALTERSALGVLPGKTHADSLASQTRKGERLCRRPVKRMFSRRHLLPYLQQLLYFGMRLKICGQARLRFQPADQFFARNRGGNRVVSWLRAAAQSRPDSRRTF